MQYLKTNKLIKIQQLNGIVDNTLGVRQLVVGTSSLDFLFGRGRAAERFAFVAPCGFVFLLNLHLTFTLCLSSKI